MHFTQTLFVLLACLVLLVNYSDNLTKHKIQLGTKIDLESFHI